MEWTCPRRARRKRRKRGSTSRRLESIRGLMVTIAITINDLALPWTNDEFIATTDLREGIASRIPRAMDQRLIGEGVNRQGLDMPTNAMMMTTPAVLQSVIIHSEIEIDRRGVIHTAVTVNLEAVVGAP
jgi:hypothetical protein